MVIHYVYRHKSRLRKQGFMQSGIRRPKLGQENNPEYFIIVSLFQNSVSFDRLGQKPLQLLRLKPCETALFRATLIKSAFCRNPKRNKKGPQIAPYGGADGASTINRR
jgi:hypothetical protein